MPTNPNPFLRSSFDAVADQQAVPVEPVQAPPVAPSPVIPAISMPERAAPEVVAPAVQAPVARASTDNLAPPPELRDVFEASARAYNVPVNVLMALGHQESRYDTAAIGQPTKWGRAKGIMQYLDSTADGLGINPLDPNQAIPAAAKQLRDRLDKGASMDDAVKEHFAGPDRNGWGEKTRVYGDEVLGKAGEIAKLLYGDAPAAPDGADAPAATDPNQAALDKLNGVKPNSFSTSMPRSAYQATFQSMNPQAGPAAIQAVMAQYDKDQEARNKAGGNRVQDKFAQMQSPEATFNAKLNKKLQAGNEGLAQALPGNAQPANPAGAPKERPGIVDQATGDFGRGIDNLKALGYGSAGLAADASGQDADATDFLTKYVAIQNDIAKNNPATIGTYKNIKGMSDAGRYAIEAVAENLPMLIPAVLTGGVGAFSAKAAAQRLVVGMVEKQVAAGVARTVAEQQAAKFVARTILGGQVAGAAASSIPMEAGSIMGDIYQDTGKKAAGTALAYGIPAGLLDTIEPVMALRKVAGPIVDQVAGSIIKRLGVEAGKQFLTEAGTEGLQTILEEAGKASASGKKLMTPELLDNVIDSMLKGGIGGAGIGVASQGVHDARGAVAERMNTPARQVADAINGNVAATSFTDADAVARASMDPNAGAIDPSRTAMTPEQRAASAPPAPAAPVVPTGPLSAAVHAAVPVAAPAEDTFTIQGDDGTVHQLAGDTITPVAPPAGPLADALHSAAADHSVNPAAPPEMPPAPAPAPPPLESLTTDDLRAQLKQVAGAIKENRTAELVTQRKAIEKEIGARAKEAAAETAKLAEEPTSTGPFDTVEDANKMAPRVAEKTAVVHEVVKRDGKFHMQPFQENGNGTANSNDVGNAGNDRGPGNRDAGGDKPTVGNGDDADRDVLPAARDTGAPAGTGRVSDAKGDDAASGSANGKPALKAPDALPATPQAKRVRAPANPDAVAGAAVSKVQPGADVAVPAVDAAPAAPDLKEWETNPYHARQFATEAYARKFMADKQVDGEKFEAVQTAPARWKLQPKAEAAPVVKLDPATDPDVQEYKKVSVRVNAEEKDSDPADWTKAQKAAWTAGDWQKFSKLRGYTDGEISNFARHMELAPKLDARYGEGFSQSLATDPYHEAQVAVLKAGRASQSLVQRTLKVSYAEAGNMLDRMQADGVISAPDASGDRSVVGLKDAGVAPAVADLTGKQIDKEWHEFAKDSGTLNVDRAEMPQVKAEHRGALTQFLLARGIAHEQMEMPAGDLKPTQREFSPAKVEKAKNYEGGERSILVSSDNHVLDGHHQWLAKMDSNEPVKVIKLDAPIKTLLAEVKEFPSAEVRDGATAAAQPEPAKPRVEYVKPLKGAPAYVDPAQRGVVDYMNGDISKAELIKRFAAASMTDGQVRSVTDRISDSEGGWTLGDQFAVQREQGKYSADDPAGEDARKAAAKKPAAEKVPEVAPEAPPAPKPLDHGELNIPNRTKNIDAELDKYKATQAKAAKASTKNKAAETRADKARAKELFAEVGEDIVARHGEKLGAKELRKELDQMVKWEPKKFIKLAEKHISETAAAESSESFDITDERTIEVDGVRRPINNSAGRPVAQTFAGQMAFWKFMGDSAVVDEKGRPIVAYHGSAKDFSEFDAAKLGNNTGHVTAQMGFFFSVDPGVSDIFTEAIDQTSWPVKMTSKNGASTMPVYLSIKKPLEMTVTSFRELEPWTRAELLKEGYDGVRIIGEPRLAETMGGDEWRADTWVALDPEQIKSATGNNSNFDPTDADITHDLSALMADGPLSRLEEPKRVVVQDGLARLQKLRGAGKIDDAAYRNLVEKLIGKVDLRPQETARGAEEVAKQLEKAKRQGKLDPKTVDFALWALSKSPSLATDLAIAVQSPGQRNVSGSYESSQRIMTLVSGRTNVGTAVHEILHHTERMMPAAIQKGISKAWFDAYMEEFNKAGPSTRAALEDMLRAGAGDKQAMNRTMEAFADGALMYAKHYQLVNASEFWAVNATRIMAGRYAAETAGWASKAKQWIASMIAHLRGALSQGYKDKINGAKAKDAPILAALEAVLNGDGQQLQSGMIKQMQDAYDISAAADPQAAADTGLTPPEQGLARRVQAAIQNNQNRVKQVQDRIESLAGAPIKREADYYGAETNRPGRIATRLEDGSDKLLEPLMARLAKSGYTQAQLESLLHAMHAEERNAAVARINPQHDPESADYVGTQGSGMDDDVAQAILATYEGATELHEIAQQARDIAKATLDLKQAYGLISDERRATLDDAYESYVPLKGDGEYGPKMNRAMGHTEREENIMGNIARDYAQAVVVGEKNLARQSLLQMVLRHPDDALWTARVPPKGRYVAGEVFNVKRNSQTVAQFTDQSQVAAYLDGKGAEAGQYTVETSSGEQVVEFTKPLQDNEVMVYVKGQGVRLQIHDDVLAAQLRPLDNGQMGVMLEAMRSLNRHLSKVYTGYNPSFILRNTARDALTGTINMLGNEGAGIAAKAWTKYPAALATLVRWAHSKQVPAGAMGDYLREYRDHGGKVGASWMSDLEQQGKSLNAMFDDAAGLVRTAKSAGAKRTAALAWRKTVGKLAHVIEVINQGTENALRLSLFVALRQAGQTPGQAAQAAKGVTVNFDRKGTSTPALGAFYLFLNPAIQGTANAANTLSNGKHKYQAWAALGGLATLGYALAAHGMDDDKDRWLGRQWDERTKNFILRIGTHELKIPVSQEFAPFFAFGTAMAEASRGESKMSTAARLFSSFVDAYFPLNGAYRADSDNHARDLALAVVPTIAKPYSSIAFNVNAFGSDLMPESAQTKDRPDNLKMFRGTKNTPYDKAAQAIAAGGVALGARSYENDISKVSPETLKLLWRTYTGGLGGFIADSTGVTGMALEDASQIESGDIPIVKDFWRPVDVKPVQGRLYDLERSVRAINTEFKLAAKAGDAAAIQQLAADPETARVLGVTSLVATINKASGQLADQAVDVNANKSLTGAEKRAKLKEIDAQREQLYRIGINAFK